MLFQSSKVFRHWAQQSAQFLKQIERHLRKTGVDYVVIDLRGATKEQIKAVTAYVNKLTRWGLLDASRIYYLY